MNGLVFRFRGQAWCPALSLRWGTRSCVSGVPSPGIYRPSLQARFRLPARQVCDFQPQVPVSSGGPTLLVYSTTRAAVAFYATLLPSTADAWPLYRAPGFVLLHWRASITCRSIDGTHAAKEPRPRARHVAAAWLYHSYSQTIIKVAVQPLVWRRQYKYRTR